MSCNNTTTLNSKLVLLCTDGSMPVQSLGITSDDCVVAYDGITGPTGPAGSGGGVTGPTGDAGDVGPTGMKGDTGDAGDVGPTGMKGDTGDAGDVGPTGMKGDTGDAGDVGPTGMKGDTGDAGDVGPTGMKGDTGDAGDVGPTGMKGDTGDVGPTGPGGPVCLFKAPVGVTGQFVAVKEDNNLLALPNAVWCWQASIDSTQNDGKAIMATDSCGHVYVAGSGATGAPPGFFNRDDGKDFDGLTSSGEQVFIGQLDPNGFWIYNVSIDSTAADRCPSVVVDSCDYVVVAGHGANGAAPNFYDKQGNVALTGRVGTDNQVFVGKMNFKGDWQWQVSIDSLGSDSDPRVSTDKDNNIYVAVHTATGTHQPTFYGRDNTSAFAGHIATTKQVVVAKLSPDGVWQWAVAVDSGVDDCNPDVVADRAGNVYVAGFGASGVAPDFYATDGSTVAMTGVAGSGQQIFLAKLRADGVWQWNARVDASTTDETHPRLAVDEKCRVYLVGSGASAIGNPPVFYNAGIGSIGGFKDAAEDTKSQVFLGCIDSDGTWSWNVSVTGDDHVDSAHVAVDNKGDVYVAGKIAGTDVPRFRGVAGAIELTGPAGVAGQLFLGKVGPNGTGGINWHYQVTVDSSAEEFAPYVTVDRCGNVYFAGHGASDVAPEYRLTDGSPDFSGRTGVMEQLFVAKLLDGCTMPLVGVVTGVDGGNSVVKYDHVVDVDELNVSVLPDEPLVPGCVYYLTPDGRAITRFKLPNWRAVGVALSATELRLNSVQQFKWC